MSDYSNIFAYTLAHEVNYKKPITLQENWSWSMSEHIKKAVIYKNSQLMNGKDDWTPVKNIVRPILNLQYRAEGWDVKDITLYVDDPKQYHKSFLLKKFHERWAREQKMDTVIDSMVESYVDYGGALLKNVNDVKPEVVPLETIAFCDQTDILSGPIGIKHYYSADQLMAMSKVGWGETSKGADVSLEEVVYLSRLEKKENESAKSEVPGKNIEIYEVHGNFPKSYLDASASDKEFEGQLHIISFYRNDKGEKVGLTLFKGREKKMPFKFIKRDPIHGRALGFGGVEELEEAQVWVNYDMIRKQHMLDNAAIMALKTTDPTFKQKNDVRNIKPDGIKVWDVTPGTDVAQVDTFPRNIKLYDESTQEWEAHAQQMGSAADPIMGEKPSAGTPFKLQELVTAEAHSLHEYRKGKLATFWEEVMVDWIMPHLSRVVTKEQTFSAELSLDELQYVMDALVQCESNNMVKEKVLNGELVKPEDVEGYKEIVRGDFRRKGNKHFFKILEGEMKDAPISVKVNIVGKQKYLAGEVDKLVNLARTLIPQGQDPLGNKGFVKLLNQIIEKSGLDPVDFTDFTPTQTPMMAQDQMQGQMPQMPQLPAQMPQY